MASVEAIIIKNTSGTPVEVTGANAIKSDSSHVTQPVSASSLPLPTGALSESDFDTKVGSLTEDAPASDTASSGLNGRLQRLAQRLTSLIALFPTSLGQKTKDNSLAVTIASDQDTLPTSLAVWTPTKLISAASTNATSVKGSAGQIGYIHAINLNAAVRYLKIYNKATSPTVGTDTPVHTFPIPASTTGAGFVLPIPLGGIDLGTGIAIALTTGVADADTGAVAANEIIINIGYK